MNQLLIFLTLCLFSTFSYAGEADVIKVDIKKTNIKKTMVGKIGYNTYQFEVTVYHKDEGWKHYANKWDVMGKDGTIFGTRVLYHPHDDEQPFTRNLSGVMIPSHVKKVIVRAHDFVHQYGGKVLTLELPQ